MTHDESKQRIEAFALREGMTFATLIGMPRRDLEIVVATIVAAFEPGAVYAEREVNDRLEAWLEGVGAHVETDRVTLRRWLVDTAVLSRNADCSDYRVTDATRLDLVRGLDGAAIADGARRARADQRARRKTAWLQRSVTTGQ